MQPLRIHISFKLVCVGISSYIGIQTFVNLAGISGTIPLTGVPLPFMTFGGSSMLLKYRNRYTIINS